MLESNPEVNGPRTRGRLESIAINTLAGAVVLGGLGIGLERLTFSDINDGPTLVPDVQIIHGTPDALRYVCSGDDMLVRLSSSQNSPAVVCVSPDGK